MVQLAHLSKSFVTPGEATPVLHDLDLTILPGEKASLIGPSGSGKSTLLALIAGLLRPDAGTVEVTESTLQQTLVEVAPNTEVKAGYQVRFEVPITRLSPSVLARLTEKSAVISPTAQDPPSVVESSTSAAALHSSRRWATPLRRRSSRSAWPHSRGRWWRSAARS